MENQRFFASNAKTLYAQAAMTRVELIAVCEQLILHPANMSYLSDQDTKSRRRNVLPASFSWLMTKTLRYIMNPMAVSLTG